MIRNHILPYSVIQVNLLFKTSETIDLTIIIMIHLVLDWRPFIE